MSNTSNLGTTTQTGPDGLVTFGKEEAVATLEKLWKVRPRWIPRHIDRFNYPFLQACDYKAICGGQGALPEELTPLLDIQREKGYISGTDFDTSHPYVASHRIDIVGSLWNKPQDDRYLLDPISGQFVRIPATNEGRELYHEFYLSRFHYIESIPGAFNFLGREQTGDHSTTEEAIEAMGRTVVIVCGLGTGGGETTIRLGKQFPNINLALIDGGVFGPENIDRQVATPGNIGLNKTLAVAAKVFENNPMIKNLYCVPDYVSERNIDSLLGTLVARMNVEDPIVQIVDEIDITEKETLIAKAELHHAAIRLAARLKRPVYVHWSIDMGASGEVVGLCRYTGSETEIFNGYYSRQKAQLPAVLAMYDIIPKKALGLEMIEDIKRRMKKDGKLEHVSQTGLAAIGVAKQISTRILMVSMGYGPKLVKRSFHDDLRQSFKTRNRALSMFKRWPVTAAVTVGAYLKRRKLLKNIEK